MEKEIKRILNSLAAKLQLSITIAEEIDKTDDIETLAEIALRLLDKALYYKANCLDFKRLENIFGYYYGFNFELQKNTLTKYQRILLKYSGVYLDGNFRNDRYMPNRLKALIPEACFGDISYDFYGASSEIFHDIDRINPHFSEYFFDDNADAIVFDDQAKVSLALITYLRRSDTKALVIKRYIGNSNKIGYVEEEIPLELEKMYFCGYDNNGNFIESYEKMYLDALREKGIYAFLEAMSIVDKVNYKKVMAIRNVLFAKEMERLKEGNNELRRISGTTIS